MEIAKLILDYVKALIWPSVVIVIVLLFRSRLNAILVRLRKADLPGGVSLDFQEEIQEGRALSQQVAQQVDNPNISEDKKKRPTIPLTEANARMLSLELRPSPSGLDMNYYRNLASQDPNLALAGLRIEIDVLARNLAQGFGVDVSDRDSGGRLLHRLRESGAITNEQLQLALKVMKLCNAAIHGQMVSREQADEVIDIADILSKKYLDWLSWGFSDEWRPKNKN